MFIISFSLEADTVNFQIPCPCSFVVIIMQTKMDGISNAVIYGFYKECQGRNAASIEGFAVLTFLNEPIHILVADDDSSVAISIRLTLGGPGYILENTSDGYEALERIKNNPDYFDLLILDHYIPSLRGNDLVTLLRKSGFNGKIVILSGYLSSQLKLAYGAQSVDRFLEKPFDLHDLRDVIYDLCRSRW